MTFQPGQIYYGPDDRGKHRPHLLVGVLQDHKAGIIIPITDYDKCPDKSCTFTEEDHDCFTKDCALYFKKTTVLKLSKLSDYNYKPPPFNAEFVQSVVNLAVGSSSKVPKVKIEAIKLACQTAVE